MLSGVTIHSTKLLSGVTNNVRGELPKKLIELLEIVVKLPIMLSGVTNNAKGYYPNAKWCYQYC